MEAAWLGRGSRPPNQTHDHPIREPFEDAASRRQELATSTLPPAPALCLQFVGLVTIEFGVAKDSSPAEFRHGNSQRRRQTYNSSFFFARKAQCDRIRLFLAVHRIFPQLD
jgi:hypothetical protein